MVFNGHFTAITLYHVSASLFLVSELSLLAGILNCSFGIWPVEASALHLAS